MFNNKINVSIVIPCYNVEEYIESVIMSAVRQKARPEKIVCIDDGSTDGTLKILERYEDRYDNVILVSQANKGANVARNVGLNYVSSEYVQFLDADDVLNHNKIAHQIKLINSSGFKPDVIAASCEEIPLDQEYSGSSGQRCLHPDNWIGLIITGLGLTSSFLWRTEKVKNVGGWNPYYKKSHEYELLFRMLKNKCEILRDPKPLTIVQKRSDSSSNEDPVESARVWLRLRKEIYDYLLEADLLTPEREQALLKTTYFRLHMLAEEEPETALKWHRVFIPSDYIPDDPWLGLGRVYVLLYRRFGFSRAERLHRYWLRLRRLFA